LAGSIRKKRDVNDYSLTHLTLIPDRTLLNALLLESRVNVHRLLSCWRRTFWARAVITRNLRYGSRDARKPVAVTGKQR